MLVVKMFSNIKFPVIQKQVHSLGVVINGLNVGAVRIKTELSMLFWYMYRIGVNYMLVLYLFMV